MADVTALRDRGQMLLVGALALATTFLVLSLLLNSVIYTENLATRRTNADADHAETFRVDGVAGAEKTIAHVNRNGDRNYSTRYSEYATALDEWTRIRTNFSAVNGRFTEVSALSGREGTRIVDDNASTNLTARDGTASWTVAPDVKARNFVIDVNTSSPTLAEESESTITSYLNTGSSGVYRAVIDDGTETAIAVYNDTGTSPSRPTVLVYESDTGEYGTCPAVDGRIDVFNHRVDGEFCRPLTRVAPSGNYDVRYVDGDLAAGTYNLTVDRLEDPFRTSANDATHDTQCTASYVANDSATPYTTPAIYSTTVRLDFESVGTTYRTTERAAPAEPGSQPAEPRFTSMTVAESTPGNFTVSWSVTDPDGDLASVNVSLLDTGGGTENTSGPHGASGTVTLTDSSESVYYVEVVATDSAGNERRLRERHDADGDDLDCPP